MTLEDTKRMTENWGIAPSLVLMHPQFYRDIVVWTLLEEGWSEKDACAEADRRLAVMAEAQESEEVLWPDENDEE